MCTLMMRAVGSSDVSDYNKCASKHLQSYFYFSQFPKYKRTLLTSTFNNDT